MPNTSNIKFATCDLCDNHKNDTSGDFRGVFGVRVQIHRAFGTPSGCDALHRNEIGI